MKRLLTTTAIALTLAGCGMYKEDDIENRREDHPEEIEYNPDIGKDEEDGEVKEKDGPVDLEDDSVSDSVEDENIMKRIDEHLAEAPNEPVDPEFYEEMADLYSKNITMKQLEGIMERDAEHEPFMVYIGQPSCPYCKTLMPKITKILDGQMKIMKYKDINDIFEEGEDGSTIALKFGIYGTPTLLWFENNTVTDVTPDAFGHTAEEIKKVYEEHGIMKKVENNE